MLKYPYFYAHRFDLNTVLGLRVCALWFAGLSLGFFAVRFCGDSVGSFVSQAAVTAPRLFDLICVTVLPLLLSACAAACSCWWGLYLVCFGRSVLLGLALGALRACYGGASVLMAVLLLFSSLMFGPVLLWYWWRRLCLGMEDFRRDGALCLGVGLALGVTEYCFISPFLADILRN